MSTSQYRDSEIPHRASRFGTSEMGRRLARPSDISHVRRSSGLAPMRPAGYLSAHAVSRTPRWGKLSTMPVRFTQTIALPQSVVGDHVV